MITGITVENFKGIGIRQELVIRPLTLLFGANSAGKSTFLHVLHYAREIVERHNLDADVTASGGDFVDLGGYLNLLHREGAADLNKDIVLRFDLDMHSSSLLELIPVDECLLSLKRSGEVGEDTLDLSTIGDDVETASIELTIAWSARRQIPYVKRYVIGLNGESVAEIEANDPWSDANIVHHVNVAHPLLAWKSPDDVEQFESSGILDSLYSPLRHPIHELYFTKGQPDPTVEEVAASFMIAVDEVGSIDEETTRAIPTKDEDSSGEFSLLIGRQSETKQYVIQGAQFAPDAWTEQAARVALDRETSRVATIRARFVPLLGLTDAFPHLDHSLSLGLRPDESDTPPQEKYLVTFRQLMDRLLRGPALGLKQSLERFRYLGPLRSAVPRNYAPPRFPDPGRWPTGEAAWDELCRDPEDLCYNVSTWLSEKDKLDTGYSIRVDEYREISIESRLWGLLRAGKPFDDVEPDELIAMVNSLRGGKRLILTATKTGTEVQLKDVGEGLTQMIPVVVAVLDPAGGNISRKGGLVGIEQPELHLNPRQQAALGDLLIAGALEDPRNTLIVETHSQPLILRILKRMRETAAADGAPVIPVQPSDISIWYVDNEEGPTELIEIRVGNKGEFLQQWPDDFFDQAFLERFA